MTQLPYWLEVVRVIAVPIGVIVAAGLAAWVATSARREETRHRYADGKAAAMAKFAATMERGTSLRYDMQNAANTNDAEALKDLEDRAKNHINEFAVASAELSAWFEGYTREMAHKIIAAAESKDLPAETTALIEFTETAAAEIRATRQGRRNLKRFSKAVATQPPASLAP